MDDMAGHSIPRKEKMNKTLNIYWGFLGVKKSGPVLVDMVPDLYDFALEHLPVGIK